MKKMFYLLVILGLFLINANFVHADEEDFAQAEEIINKKISCDDLSEEQLEILGDYYMEQMHPGKAHETMDKMMGGEGSESLKQIHINMARRLYCEDNIYVGYGMMSGNMMNNWMMKNMMGNYYGTGITIYSFFGFIVYLLLIIALILLIIFLFKKINESGRR